MKFGALLAIFISFYYVIYFPLFVYVYFPSIKDHFFNIFPELRPIFFPKRVFDFETTGKVYRDRVRKIKKV